MSIRKACKLLGHAKSTFFQVRNNRAKIEKRDEKVIAFVLRKVKAIRKEQPKAGGKKMYKEISQDPDFAKYKFGRDRFFDILRANDLLVKRRKKPVYTTDSSKWRKQYPNLVEGLTPTRPEEIFVADITYFRIGKGFVYGHIVTDAYSKKIMGYEVSDNMKASSTLAAMQMAVENRIYDEALIHHSDRGFQYLSKLYTDFLKENKITISVTQDGNPYDNAVAERINGILKGEFDFNRTFNNLYHAKQLMEKVVKIYNSKRLHWSNHLLTPDQMHQQRKLKIKTYRKDKDE